MEQENQTKSLNTISTAKSIICFLIGSLGFQLLALLVFLIVCSFFSSEKLETSYGLSLANAYTYFLTYALVPLIIATIIGFYKFGEIFKSIKVPSKIGKGILYGFGLIALSIVINVFTSLFTQVTDNTNQEAVVSVINTAPFLAFFFIVIFAPVAEELTYRYSFFGEIYKHNKILAFVLSSLIFGIIHFDYTGIFTMSRADAINEWLNLPSYIASGAYLTYVFYKEDDLLCSTTAHLTNNFISFLTSIAVTSSIEGEVTSSLISLIGNIL